VIVDQDRKELVGVGKVPIKRDRGGDQREETPGGGKGFWNPDQFNLRYREWGRALVYLLGTSSQNGGGGSGHSIKKPTKETQHPEQETTRKRNGPLGIRRSV